ncbi:MAG: phosphoribosylformylglycinamidine cyclo-ligase [Anaerolineales bacterium]|jgi:phosphoribosylaminoimidazole synthetase|nr:phosphoribosylformylglycinamidine cyclo-ligase [Anaerolineales bacterium]HJO32948.1 phosphoribosylformylglycinamidine cyclo-ligase [Anaerolineales bacterium]
MSSGGSAYAASGVDIDAGNEAVALAQDALTATYGAEVLGGVGAFGGLYDAAALREMSAPVLAASVDGVGTKVLLAERAGEYAGIGHDLVNHCVNDILAQGASPLFFLDYVASAKLSPKKAAAVVKGVADACRNCGCALLGGETAEMPDVYAADAFDLVGAVVGVVEKMQRLPRGGIAEGDLLVGLRSSGPHTNGYTLIRSLFADVSLESVPEGHDRSLGEMLLAPHRCYYPLLRESLGMRDGNIKALAHITGGGVLENLPRALPDDLDAVVRMGTWPLPAVFSLIQQRGCITDREMYRVFNMGLGMVAVVSPSALNSVQQSIADETVVIGELVGGDGRVRLT